MQVADHFGNRFALGRLCRLPARGVFCRCCRKDYTHGNERNCSELAAYFILSGLATLFSYGRALWVNFQGSFTLATVVGVIGIGFSLAFLYVGISLPRLLRSSAGRVVTLLYVSTGWVLFVFLLGLLEGLAPVAVITLLLSLLILWYLLKNVRRLAAEAKVSSSGTVPSGT